MISMRERIEGGLIGLLVGDALGVPYEFHEPEDIPPPHQIEMTPPAGFRRSYPDVLPGTWSDDGAQALCLLATILHCDRFDPDDFGRRLQNWRYLGYMAVGGDVFDVGITTQQVVQRLADGVSALKAGARGESSNGNGSLMRVLPLVLWHRGSDAELVRDAMLQSLVTHAHIRSQLCCALYCLWARGALEGRVEAWEQAVRVIESEVRNDPVAIRELRDPILAARLAPTRGTGYVVDCLWSARRACDATDFESVVRAAISFGNDTDTTACVAGGIAGITHGLSGIPMRWRVALREMETVQALLTRLLKHRQI
ncbi:MAG: ADP-ribosylglycohydrolase family protein [Panacagrimonas sp.]